MTANMAYRNIYVCTAVLQAVRKEVRKIKFKETGGPLVGYISKDLDLVIVNAGGPGPRAKHSIYYVIIDGEYAQNYCQKAFASSEGIVDYVGDWHRHIYPSIRPSSDDLEAMLTMADFCQEGFPLVSLIYRKTPEKVTLFTLANNELVKTKHVLCKDPDFLRMRS